MKINFIKKNLYFLIFCSFTAFSAIISCAEFTETTTIQVKSFQIKALDGDTLVNPNIVAYLFKADTATHMFESYQDAANGIITNRYTLEKEKAVQVATYNELDNQIMFDETSMRMTVGVVCDTQSKIYYYRNIITNTNLSDLYLQVIMKQYIFATNPDTIDVYMSWEGKNL